MYLVMAHHSSSKSVHPFLLQEWRSLLIFHLLTSRLPREGLRKISELKRSICTSKQQASFLCDFVVFEPFDANIGGSQVLEVFAARAWQVA